MWFLPLVGVFFFGFFLPPLAFGQSSPKECVILLHGLARTRNSMTSMAEQLEAQGYRVVNQGYPSRKKTIEILAGEAIPAALAACRAERPSRIHFVTHSMGGILVRYYLKQSSVNELGRVVMLSPPNGGSEVVDRIGDWLPFRLFNGPAGSQLGTGSDALPNRLGRVYFELGVLAGDRSINPINSLMIPGADDGKVSTLRARIDGMRDYRILHVSHPFIMTSAEVISETIYFLRHGTFQHEIPKP